MSTTAVIPQLAPEVLALPHNRFHAQAVRAANEAALWSALTGIELLAIKGTMKHGDWQAWVAAHCAFSYRTAARHLDSGRLALAALETSAQQPSLVGPAAFEAGKARIAELLEGDGLAEQRVALIAAIRPPKPTPAPQIEAPAPKKPAKPRPPVTERPLFSPKALNVVVERWHHTPEPVRHAFYDANRAEILAYAERINSETGEALALAS
jgi:hypothetical protein